MAEEPQPGLSEQEHDGCSSVPADMSGTSSYRTLLISRIPVERREDGLFTDPLWSRDINTNAQTAAELFLACPVRPATDKQMQPLAPRIKVTDSQQLSPAKLEELILQADVVEIPGNFGWFDAKLARQAIRLARRHGRLSIVGISSNRARTTVMNAADGNLLHRLHARLRASSIRLTQIHLARSCDGVRVVGQGLAPLVEKHAKALHVDVASWIRDSDFRTSEKSRRKPISVVIASRLELMKGVHVGVDAVAQTVSAGNDIELAIIGVGAQEEPLRAFVEGKGISKRTRFLGHLSYPEPFFDVLRKTDFVLLTNLNDEQPRLIFDAISQGAIPVCPRSKSYEALKLDPQILYTQGSATALRDTLQTLIALSDDEIGALREELLTFAKSRTLDSMHFRRQEWISSLLREKLSR